MAKPECAVWPKAQVGYKKPKTSYPLPCLCSAQVHLQFFSARAKYNANNV